MNAPESSFSGVLHDGAEEVGSDVRNTSPWLSTATQRNSEVHDTAVGALPASNVAGADQLSDEALWAADGPSDAPNASTVVRAASIVRAPVCLRDRLCGVVGHLALSLRAIVSRGIVAGASEPSV